MLRNGIKGKLNLHEQYATCAARLCSGNAYIAITVCANCRDEMSVLGLLLELKCVCVFEAQKMGIEPQQIDWILGNLEAQNQT